MTPRGTRSLWTAFTATVVGFTALLVGCASLGPLTPVHVSEVKSVAGTWKGVVYESGSEPERREGSREVLVNKGRTRGRTNVALGGHGCDRATPRARHTRRMRTRSEGALLFSHASDHMEGRGDPTMASISLQDLQRRLYDEAKAETKRFWGLYVGTICCSAM